jgi:hypothetical protein
MFAVTTRGSARILAGSLAMILLASCVPNEGGLVTDEPPTAPAVDEPLTAPAGDPAPGGGDPDEGAVGERPLPTHDWDDLEREVSLSGGWRLRDCDGDAPLRCLHGPDGSVRGVIELLRIEEHDGLVGTYDVDRASAALQELADGFDAWLIDDRGAACPHHEVELDPMESTSVDGVPAVIRGHRVLAPQGGPVESSLVAYIADGGDLVLVTVIATAPGGCTHVEEIDELTPLELDHLDAELRHLIRHGSIPQG